MNDRVKEIEERRRWLESHSHTESEAVLCADIEYLLAELKKRDALSLDGLVITRFESDDITGQEFAVYCDDEGRPRIKLCGRNQQAMNDLLIKYDDGRPWCDTKPNAGDK